MTTWRKELEEAFKTTGDSIENMTFSINLSLLDVEFDDGYGTSEGPPFTAWSDKYVYFSDEYDGSDYITWVQRHPPGYLEEQIEKALLK